MATGKLLRQTGKFPVHHFGSSLSVLCVEMFINVVTEAFKMIKTDSEM